MSPNTTCLAEFHNCYGPVIFIPFWNESESRSVMSDSLQPHRLSSPWNPPGQNIGVGSFSLLQGIFPTQGLNPSLPHCRQTLYCLSHQGCSVSKNLQKIWFLVDKLYVCVRIRNKPRMPIITANAELMWRRKCQPTPVFLPGQSHRQRSLVGYSPWGHKESDTT